MINRGSWKNRKNLFKFCDKNIVQFAQDDMEFNRICQKQTLFITLMENNFGVNIMTSL